MKSLLSAALALGMEVSATVVRLNSQENEFSLRPRQATACDNSATSRGCWGNYSIDTNYYNTFPDTGVTREYWLSIDGVSCAPDGYQRTCMTINGTVPGPTIVVS